MSRPPPLPLTFGILSVLPVFGFGVLTISLPSASSLGMMSEEEKKMQRIEDIKELLS